MVLLDVLRECFRREVSDEQGDVATTLSAVVQRVAPHLILSNPSGSVRQTSQWARKVLDPEAAPNQRG